jgi:HAD superfamily hydrolase (TIGR01509 family)
LLPVTDALPAAVLWDMDGTLIDSEPYWFIEQEALVERFGGSWSADEALALVGAGLWVSARILQDKGVAWDADRIVDHLTDAVMERIRREVPWRPGARELLREVRAAGVPMALVTMSVRRMAEQVADAIPADIAGHDGAFRVIVSGSDVTEPKPHPEAYLRAAQLLEVDIASTIAIEDSPTGLAAAVAAGAASIGVPHILPIDEAPGHTIWSTLDGRHIDDLRVVLARHRSGVAGGVRGGTA